MCDNATFLTVCKYVDNIHKYWHYLHNIPLEESNDIFSSDSIRLKIKTSHNINELQADLLFRSITALAPCLSAASLIIYIFTVLQPSSISLAIYPCNSKC